MTFWLNLIFIDFCTIIEHKKYNFYLFGAFFTYSIIFKRFHFIIKNIHVHQARSLVNLLPYFSQYDSQFKKKYFLTISINITVFKNPSFGRFERFYLKIMHLSLTQMMTLWNVDGQFMAKLILHLLMIHLHTSPWF